MSFITSDHGGHDRSHGTDKKEDITIPLIIKGSNFAENVELNNVYIIGIAPTIINLLKAEPAEEWERCGIL